MYWLINLTQINKKFINVYFFFLKIMKYVHNYCVLYYCTATSSVNHFNELVIKIRQILYKIIKLMFFFNFTSTFTKWGENHYHWF